MAKAKNKKRPDRQRYGTPQWLFDALAFQLGPFGLDVCADGWSAKCLLYIPDEALASQWDTDFFCNPPFAEQSKWVKYGILQAAWHGVSGVFVCTASFGSRWFAEVQPSVNTYMLTGRVQFDPPPGVVCKGGNDRDTMVLHVPMPGSNRGRIKVMNLDRWRP